MIFYCYVTVPLPAQKSLLSLWPTGQGIGPKINGSDVIPEALVMHKSHGQALNPHPTFVYPEEMGTRWNEY